MIAEIVRPVIIDAGPTLTFVAAGYRDLLVEVVSRRESRLSTPESVVEEVARKAKQQKRFAGCDTALASLIEHGQIELLMDDIRDDALSAQVRNITGVGSAVRLGQSRDLGETMVIAHALKQRAAGVEARVFIDEWRGQGVAEKHGVKVVSTESILVGAIKLQLIPDRGVMRNIYERLRTFYDGLVHIDQTGLLNRDRYRRSR